MILLLLLILVGLVAGSSLYMAVRGDRGPLTPPRSHDIDPSFLPPSQRIAR